MPKAKTKNTFQFRAVENLLKNHRNAFAWMVRWGQGQVHAMVDGLTLVGLLLCILLPIGVGISWVGNLMNVEADTLRYDSSLGDTIIGVGNFISLLSGLSAGIVFGFQLLRLRLLTAAVVGGNAILRTEIGLASAPLPGKNFDIGQLFREIQASHIIKVTMSVFGAVMGGALYASLLPVYTSILLLLSAMLVGAFLAYAAVWIEGSYWIPKIKRASIAIGGILLLIVFPIRFAFPAYVPDFGKAIQSYVNGFKAEAKVKKAENDGDNQLRVIAAQKIAELSAKRTALVSSEGFGDEKTMQELKDLNEKIAKWQSGAYTTPTPVATPTPKLPTQEVKTFSAPAGWQVVSTGTIPVNTPLTKVGEYKGKILILMRGDAYMYKDSKPADPDGWPEYNAQSAYSLPNAPIFCSLVKYGGKIEKAGKSKEISLPDSTDVYLGPNDEPGKYGAGFSDNRGSWEYAICTPI